MREVESATTTTGMFVERQMTKAELYAIVQNEVQDIVAGLNPGVKVCMNDSRYDPTLACATMSLYEVIASLPPAYCVLVAVNGIRLSGDAWVTVTYTGRFGFTPTLDGYTFLEPPTGVDREDREAVMAWLRPALEAAIVKHVPAAEKARADDAHISGPVEPWVAITRIG
jgi:hypothetical protein